MSVSFDELSITSKTLANLPEEIFSLKFTYCHSQEKLSLKEYPIQIINIQEFAADLEIDLPRMTILDVHRMTDLKILNSGPMRTLHLTQIENLEIKNLDLSQLVELKVDQDSFPKLRKFKFPNLKILHSDITDQTIKYDLLRINLYKVDFRPDLFFNIEGLFSKINAIKFNNYKLRLMKSRHYLLRLFLKNKIKYFWNKYLDSTKDGVSRICYLANDL